MFVAMHNSVFLALTVESLHQQIVPWARDLILQPIRFDIFLLHTGEKSIQLPVKVFAVSLAERKPHTKADHPINARSRAVLYDPLYIFRRIIDKWEDGAEPYNGWDARLLQLLQCLDPLPLCTHMGLQYPAQRLVMGGQRHLNHTFALLIDRLQQINIPQNPV